MKKSQGYNNTISYAKVISVSTLYSRHSNLTISSYSMTCLLYGLHSVSSFYTCIYSIDTILYPYTLLLELHLFYSLNLCLSTT